MVLHVVGFFRATHLDHGSGSVSLLTVWSRGVTAGSRASDVAWHLGWLKVGGLSQALRIAFCLLEESRVCAL